MDISYFAAFFLVFLRIITFFVVLNVLFPEGLPNIVKIGISIILAYFIMTTLNYSSLNSNNNILLYATKCGCEIVTGIVLGYLTNLAFMCGKIAGNLMDIQIGFNMISIFDPSSQSSATLLEKVLSSASIIIFLVINGHLILIKALADSFNVVHLGQFVLVQGSAALALNAYIQFFTIGFRIALPIVLVLIMTDIVMGLVSRTVPQLNVMILGLPVKILLGFTIFMLLLSSTINSIVQNFDLVPDLWKGFYHTLSVILVFAADEKTEQATPKKKSEAKKKGQVAKSKDVGLALSLIIITLVMSSLGDYCFQNVKNMMQVFLNNYINKNLTELGIHNIMFFAVINICITLLIFAIPVMIVGIFGSLIQTGFIFSLECLKPDFAKLNPINGFKKMFSSRTFVELFKDIFIITIVGYVGYNFVISNLSEILRLNTLNFNYLPRAMGSLLGTLFFRISLVMAIIALTDYIYQRFMFNKELKMTKQEIKEEFKQDEGDQNIKSKRKQKMREMSAKRMMASVPTATVVVANPTHFAVALQYKEGEDKAPIVVAKGVDRVALKIKEIASENQVPIIENKPLARLMYDKVEIDDEIPMDMYETVAEVLALVYKMKKDKGR